VSVEVGEGAGIGMPVGVGVPVGEGVDVGEKVAAGTSAQPAPASRLMSRMAMGIESLWEGRAVGLLCLGF
jgi:hypothetical protein